MDVLTQLVLLMPMESRQLLPSSISEAYVRDVAPLMTDKSFEEIDLRLVMNWCAEMKKKLSTSDAQRMASFSTNRNPVMVRWPCEIAKLSQKVEGVIPHDISEQNLRVEENDVGFVSETPDLDDLFEVRSNVDCSTLQPTSTIPADQTSQSSWVCVAGQVHVQALQETVIHTSTGMTTFLFKFKENTDVPGMNTVTNSYRCADTACSVAVELRPDWGRGRPAIMVGECLETSADDEGAETFSCIPPSQPLLLPGTLELPQWPLSLLEGPLTGATKRERNETPDVKAALEARRIQLKAAMEDRA